MRYPSLVRKEHCRIPIRVSLESEDLNDDGAAEVIFEKDLSCNYQNSSKKVLNGQKEYVQISGVALFNGDIAPDISDISIGSVVVFGEKRRIASGRKCRNPDGTVNYTRLELM